MTIYNGNFTVYAHINKTNGKIYVGITCQPLNKRWSNGNGYKNNSHFYSAIQKYGWNGFEHQIIASNLTKDEACNFEKILIKELNLTDDKYGYNYNYGGQHGMHSEATKLKISESVKKQEHKSGWHHTEESKRKIAEHINNNKKIICVQTGICFHSIADAAKEVCCTRANIRRAINTGIMARNYHWRLM